ncbi:hypothetical protein EJB05_48678, partial [Eragrostis curvula]
MSAPPNKSRFHCPCARINVAQSDLALLATVPATGRRTLPARRTARLGSSFIRRARFKIKYPCLAAWLLLEANSNSSARASLCCYTPGPGSPLYAETKSGSSPQDDSVVCFRGICVFFSRMLIWALYTLAAVDCGWDDISILFVVHRLYSEDAITISPGGILPTLGETSDTIMFVANAGSTEGTTAHVINVSSNGITSLSVQASGSNNECWLGSTYFSIPVMFLQFAK